MSRQRPAPLLRNAGAVACLAVAVGGCGGGSVRLDSPDLSGADRVACGGLIEALPDTVSDQPRRPVEPEQGNGAAWGDPAIVLRCGVPAPAGLDDTATCHETNGVGWFVPTGQVDDQQADVVMTTIGREQYVEVALPARYRPPAAAMVDLAPAIKKAITQVAPCV